jgi:putative PEP-CTERM system histidine kinase
MLAFASQWGHAAAAALFGALAVWTVRRVLWDRQSRMTATAFALTAIWALAASIEGPESTAARIGENARNLGWLAMMFGLWRQGAGESRTFAVVILYAILAMVGVALFAIDIAPRAYDGSPRVQNAIFFVTLMLRMMMSIGALVLVHNLYTAATPEARGAIRLPMIALSVMWIYDLNLFTISYLMRGWSVELLSLRGIAICLTAPIFALTSMRTERLTMRLSRTATFQSLSLVAIGGYLMVMVLATSAIEFVADDYARTAQVSFVFGSSMMALLLLPSKRFRAWMRVKTAKHLFQHRYDYRAEWVRFTDTIGRPETETGPLEMRVVQAIGDITESPGGLLLVPDDTGALLFQTKWNWPTSDAPAVAGSVELANFFTKTGRIVELDSIRNEDNDLNEEARIIPEWLIAEPRAWAMVPLVHFDRLAGVIILERPKIDRTLDWEDFDLLKVVGRQVASYLAEARGQATLSDVRQFDEFNRRFAFIMHDIKNLVSQLSLVTRNAEKHADNPEFRADMIATLKNSASRMNDLLARLSQHNKARAEEPRPFELGALVESVAKAKRIAHPIVTGGDMGLHAIADPARLEQALLHIVQNAVDASQSIEPVCISIRQIGAEVMIETRDNGVGMSSHFVRHDLFKAFASTKDGGFGIGAFEARALVAAMGGRIEVHSREGEGTRFNIYLPCATETALHDIKTQQAKVA